MQGDVSFLCQLYIRWYILFSLHVSFPSHKGGPQWGGGYIQCEVNPHMREKIHATETTCIFSLYMANIVRVKKEVKKKTVKLS